MAIKPILIHGPMQCGKTLNRELFSTFFHKPHIVDGIPLRNVMMSLNLDSIGFCYETPTDTMRKICTVLHYDDAVALVEAAGETVKPPIKPLKE